MRKDKKRRYAKTKPDKQHNSKPKSLLENPKIDDATKDVYAIFFDPENPKHNVAWDDIYQTRMAVFEIENPKYYEVVYCDSRFAHEVKKRFAQPAFRGIKNGLPKTEKRFAQGQKKSARRQRCKLPSDAKILYRFVSRLSIGLFPH